MSDHDASGRRAVRGASGIAFAPRVDILEQAIAFLDEHDAAGGGTEASVRRAAFARYAAGGTDFKLPYRTISWFSGRKQLPTRPVISVADAQAHEDRPALAVENAGGVVHLGALLLEGPSNARGDAPFLVMSLADARRLHPDLLARVQGKIVRRRAGRFALLATAFQNCGAFVYVPAGVAPAAPIQLVWMHGAGRVQAVFPHIVILLEEGAQVTVLERHVGESDAFVCGIMEAQVEAGARLQYVVVQQCGDGTHLRMTRTVRCERDAFAGVHCAELGGARVRTALHAHLDASGAKAELTELFLNDGMQQTTLTSMADHRGERTVSTTVARCAADDRARGGHLGSVHMRPHAQGGDASLRADALLLSKHARLDVKPELEIEADKVSAFHGATVGSLDEETLFYIQARGIARSEAARLITLAFFEPAIMRFPGDGLRDEVRTALDRKIDEATEPGHAPRFIHP